MLLVKANPVSDLGLLETKACRNGLAPGTLQADFNDFFLKSQTVFRHEVPKGWIDVQLLGVSLNRQRASGFQRRAVPGSS